MNNRQNFDSIEELKLFKQMVQRVPAYKKFLKKQNFDPEKVKNLSDLETAPIMDKANYIDQFDLTDLCWDGDLSATKYIVNSSGSTGKPYFWLRDEGSDRVSSLLYKIIYKDIFGLDKEPVLFINSFGQGSWIAGNEAFLSTLNNNNSDLSVVTVNSGIDQELIIQQLSALAVNFKNIVFAGYPPFIKDLFTVIESKKIITNKHSVQVIVGGESISELWRSNLENTISAKKVEVISIYGMSDGGGVQAFETQITKDIRKNIFRDKKSGDTLFGGSHNTAIFQYDPSIRSINVGSDGRLLINVKHGLPLFKYDTKDRGGIIDFNEGVSLIDNKATSPDLVKKFSNYPFVYLLGRNDYAVTFYGLNIYPDHIRAVIDELADDDLTGRFIIEKRENKNIEPELLITLELTDMAASQRSKETKEQLIESHIFSSLPKYNSEYGKLKQSINERARPLVSLKRHGEIGYTAGKKHKWVKKD